LRLASPRATGVALAAFSLRIPPALAGLRSAPFAAGTFLTGFAAVARAARPGFGPRSSWRVGGSSLCDHDRGRADGLLRSRPDYRHERQEREGSTREKELGSVHHYNT
jgi:hypothetical protein